MKRSKEEKQNRSHWSEIDSAGLSTSVAIGNKAGTVGVVLTSGEPTQTVVEHVVTKSSDSHTLTTEAHEDADDLVVAEEPAQVTEALSIGSDIDRALFMRSMGHTHSRLVRRHKPAITQDSFDAISKAWAKDKNSLQYGDRANFILGTQNGLYSDKDEAALKAAEERRIARHEKKKRQADKQRTQQTSKE